MSEPPRKRRKSSSPLQAPSSPLRKSPRRPSFASPTKASLARNYPNLLPTRTSPRDNVRAQGKGVHALVRGAYNTLPRELEQMSDDTESQTSQRRLEEHEGPGRGIVFSSTGKRPSRAPTELQKSSLVKAPAAQQAQLTRPVEEASNVDGPRQTKRADKRPFDPEVEKRKQEKARLQREVQELEAQVSRCTNEILAEQQRGINDVLLPTQRADLIKFITKISGTDKQDVRPVPVSSLLCSFLPFSSSVIPAPRHKHPESPMPSHRPVELKDPLPYLEMFTTFNFSTHLSLPHGEIASSSKNIHQKHTIDISGPQKLLTAQLTINIDCLSNEIIDMRILHLPSWAERELGTFMRKKAKEKDLGNACWAIDSFWDVATKRANYWHKCEKAFARLVPGQTATDTEDASVTDMPKSSVLPRKVLSRHLGRDVFILQDKHVLLKINWRVVFDWTGEAESNIDVECAVPAVWQEADAGEAFRKIPETFDSLLRTRGAFEATRIMVALLFSG